MRARASHAAGFQSPCSWRVLTLSFVDSLTACFSAFLTERSASAASRYRSSRTSTTFQERRGIRSPISGSFFLMLKETFGPSISSASSEVS